MGLTIVLIFILCHSVKWIPNIYELVRLSWNDKRQWPSWVESTTHVAHFLMSVNSSVNFYVYCVKHFKCPFFGPSAPNNQTLVTLTQTNTGKTKVETSNASLMNNRQSFVATGTLV